MTAGASFQHLCLVDQSRTTGVNEGLLQRQPNDQHLTGIDEVTPSYHPGSKLATSSHVGAKESSVEPMSQRFLKSISLDKKYYEVQWIKTMVAG